MEKRTIKTIVLVIASMLGGALFGILIYRMTPTRIYMHPGLMPQRIYLEGRELRIGEIAKELAILDGGKGLVTIQMEDNGNYVNVYANNRIVIQAHVFNGILAGLIRTVNRDGKEVMIWYDKDAKVVLEQPILQQGEELNLKKY
jgi:hypothetical protein